MPVFYDFGLYHYPIYSDVRRAFNRMHRFMYEPFEDDFNDDLFITQKSKTKK